MNPHVTEFLKLTMGADWDSLDEATKTDMVTHYSNPANMESLLYDLDPGFYQVEADPKTTGAVRQMAGKLTGGDSVTNIASGIAGQIAGAPIKAVGAGVKMAGEIAGYPMPGLDEYGRAIMDYNRPAYGDATQQFLGGVASSVGSNLATMGGATAATALLGLNPVTAIPAITLGTMAAISGGEALSDVMAEHPEYSAPGKLAYAGLYGAAEYAGERAVPVLGEALKMGKIGVGDIVKATTQDVVGEMGTALAQGLSDIGFQTGDTETPIGTRMLTAGASSLISTPLIGGGAKLLSSKIQRMQTAFDAKKIAEQDSYIDQMVESGQAQVAVPEEVLPTPEEPVATAPLAENIVAPTENIIPEPKPGEETEVGEQAPSVEDTAEFEMGRRRKVTRTPTPIEPQSEIVRGAPVVGDKVVLKAKLIGKQKLPSTVLPGFINEAKVVDITEEGNYVVEVPDVKSEDGIRTMTVTPEQIASSAELGVRNLDVKLGPKSPSAFSLLKATKSLMTDVQGWVRMMSKMGAKSDAYGQVTVRKSDGTPVVMRLDHAIMAPEGLFEKTLAHELSHIVTMIDSSTRIPGFEKARPQGGTLLGDLLREWAPMEQAVLVKPFEFAPGVDAEAIYQKQQDFVDNLYQQYEQLGKSMDGEGRKMIQDHWSTLAEEHAKVMLTDAENAAIEEEVRDFVSVHQIKDSATRTAYRKQLRNKKLAERGAAAGGLLIDEMEAVSMAFRGLKNTAANRKMLKDAKSANKEIFADFVAAKLLRLVVKDPDTGEHVELAKAFAPNASVIFDNYMMRNPAASKLFTEILTTDNSADARIAEIARGQATVEKQYADRKAAESPTAVFMQPYSGPINMLFQTFVDINFPAINAIGKNMGWDYAMEYQNKMEELAGMSSVVTPPIRKFAGIFNKGIQIIREASDKVDAEANMGVYMQLKQVAHGGRRKTATYSLADVSEGDPEIVKIEQEYDLLTGDVGRQIDAQRVLKESSIFGKPEVEAALDQVLKEFHEEWVSSVVDTIERAGIVSKAQAAVLRGNVYYATYAIEKEVFGKTPFKSVSPAVKEQTGTVHASRNPLGATIEKGIQMLWNAYLNDAKRTLIAGLPDEYKIKIEKTGSMFQEPVSKSYSLVTFKDDGKDFGYHVPKELAAGVDFQGGSHLMHNFIRALSETNNYFRQLYTTFDPVFQTRNAPKDFLRAVIRSIANKDTTGMPLGEKIYTELGLGIVPHYWNTLKDLIFQRGTEERARLEKEEDELYRHSLIMSSYDYRARDFTGATSYENIQRMWFSEFRKNSALPDAEPGIFASLLGKFTIGSRINSIIKHTGNILSPLTETISEVSRGVERMSKRAANRYYAEAIGYLPEAERKMLIRKSGSPFFLNHGEAHPLTSAIYTFFNPPMQAMYEDLQLMLRHPVVAGKQLIATSMSLGFNYGLVQALAAMGGFGEELARAWVGIPQNDKDMGVCIPFGISETGETLYFNFPIDESTAMFAKMSRLLMSRKFAEAAHTGVKKGVASLSPGLDLLFKGFMIAGGINPPTFTGQPLVPETDFNADWQYRWIAYAKHFYNTVSPIRSLYRFNFTSSEDKFARKAGKASGAWASAVGAALDFPMAQTFARMGYMKKSKIGYAETSAEMTRSLDETVNTFSILAKQYTDAAVTNDAEAMRSLLKDMADLTERGPAQAIAISEKFEELPDKVKKAVMGGLKSQSRRIFDKASKFQKIELLIQGWGNYMGETK